MNMQTTSCEFKYESRMYTVFLSTVQVEYQGVIWCWWSLDFSCVTLVIILYNMPFLCLEKMEICWTFVECFSGILKDFCGFYDHKFHFQGIRFMMAICTDRWSLIKYMYCHILCNFSSHGIFFRIKVLHIRLFVFCIRYAHTCYLIILFWCLM